MTGERPRLVRPNPHTIAAIVGLAAVAAIFWASRDYPYVPWDMGGPPGFYPRFLATVLGVLCVAVLVESYRRPAPVAVPSGRDAGRMAAVVGLLAASPWLLEWLGFRVAGTLFLLATMLLLADRRALRPRSLLALAAVAVAATLLLHLVFERAARTPLPRGVLFD